MSVITTWGFGGHGGLVSMMGWGAHAVVTPLQGAVGLPTKPQIIDSLNLVPQLTANNTEPIPHLDLAIELVPSLLVSDDVELKPNLVFADELVPNLNTDVESLVPRLAESDNLLPKLLINQESAQTPQIVDGDVLVPTVTSETPEALPQVEALEVSPSVSDTESDC